MSLNEVGLQSCVKPEFCFEKLAIGLVQMHLRYFLFGMTEPQTEMQLLCRDTSAVQKTTNHEERLLTVNANFQPLCQCHRNDWLLQDNDSIYLRIGSFDMQSYRRHLILPLTHNIERCHCSSVKNVTN